MRIISRQILGQPAAAERLRKRARTGFVTVCLADYDLVAGAYEMLAADYDWMFGDDELANGRAINHPATARLLQRISSASAVLDAACGTGVEIGRASCRERV